MSPPRIVIATKYFPPEDAASGQLMFELYESLQGKGLDVTVYTGELKERQNPDKNIIEVEYRRHPKSSKWGRILEEYSFYKNMKRKLQEIDENTTLMLTTAPANLPYIGAKLKKRKPGMKFILIVYDVYPDAALELGYVSKLNPLTRILDNITKKALISADVVIAIGEDMEDRLAKKIPGLEDKISVIPNWADPAKLYPTLVKENLFPEVSEGHTKFVYTGNIGLYYNLEYLIQAAAKLKDEKCSFIFVGEGAKKKKLMGLTHRLKTDNIHFYPYFSPEEYNKVLNSADVLLLSLKQGFEGLSVPSKFYPYMAVAKPILGMISGKSDVGIEIEDYELGFRVEPKDVDGFVDKAGQLIDNPDLQEQYGNNGLRLFKKQYTRKLSISKYLQIITNL